MKTHIRRKVDTSSQLSLEYIITLMYQHLQCATRGPHGRLPPM